MKVARGAKFQGKKKFNKPQGLEDLKKFDDSEDDDSEDDDDMNIDDALEFDDEDGDSEEEKAVNKSKNQKQTPKNIKPFDKTPGKKTPNSGFNKLTPAKNTPLNKNNQTPGKNIQTPGKNSQAPGKNVQTPGKNSQTPVKNFSGFKNASPPGQNVQTPGNKAKELRKTSLPLKLAGSPINKFGKQQPPSAKKLKSPNKNTSLVEDDDDDEDDDDEDDDDENSSDEAIEGEEEGDEEEEEDDDDNDDDDEDDDDEEGDDDQEENKNKVKPIAKSLKQITKVEPKANIQNKGLSDESQFANEAAEKRRQEDLRTLFVKKLPEDVKESDIKEACPDMIQTRLSKRAPWYGFITFADEAAAVKNYEMLKDKTIKGTQLYVDYVGAKSSVQLARKPKSGEIDPCKLFVGNLIPTTTDKMLSEAFPSNCDIFIPKRKGVSARFGFVTFRTPQAAKEAYNKMQDAKINNQIVRIMFAHKKIQYKADKRKQPQENKSQPQKKMKLETPKSKDEAVAGAAADDDDDEDDDDDDDDEQDNKVAIGGVEDDNDDDDDDDDEDDDDE